MIIIEFPDGSKKEFKTNITPGDVAKSISNSLAKKALGAVVNETVVDLSYPVNDDCSLRILTFDDPEGRELFWHSSAHLMASAVLKLFPTRVSVKVFGFAVDRNIVQPQLARVVVLLHHVQLVDLS